MLFDLFYELSVPASRHISESEVFHQTLSEWELADQCSFNTAWLVEHHFMSEYSHSSSPEVFLAAASQRTQKLRLGHAIIPLPYNHPVRVAERLATLDILSRGRVEFGFGRGFSPKEYASFGSDMKHSRSITQESLEIIQQSFAGQAVNYQGEHFQLDNIDILPKVVQQPHPPIWTAAVSPDSFEMAARLGIGVLVGPFKPWFMVKEDIKHYQRYWQQYQTNSNNKSRVAMTVGILCLENERRARELAKPAFEWFYQQLFAQTTPVLLKLYESYEYYKKLGKLQGLISKAVNLTILESMGMVIVGTPEHCVKKLRKLEKAGVNNVLCAIGAGAIDSEIVQESMRLISEQVIPQFSAQ